MKKVILILLLILLCGCGDKENSNKEVNNKNEIVENKEVILEDEVSVDEEEAIEEQVEEKVETKVETTKVETKTETNVETKTEVNEESNVNEYKVIDGILIVNKTYGLSKDYVPSNLVKCGNSTIISEVCDKFNEMKNAASNDGVNIYLQSGYRSYSTQEALYNGYVKRSGQTQADTYSARAGHSEHQSGLAFDVCSSQSSSCINSGFDDSEPALWLNNNAYKYGFILRYPNGKSDITGYKYESWHYRYVGIELANKLYNGGEWNTIEEYYGISSKYE